MALSSDFHKHWQGCVRNCPKAHRSHRSCLVKTASLKDVHDLPWFLPQPSSCRQPSGGWLNSLCATKVTLFPSAKGKGRKHRCNSIERAVQSARKGPRTYTVFGIPLMNPKEPDLILWWGQQKENGKAKPPVLQELCPAQLVLSQVRESCQGSVGTL